MRSALTMMISVDRFVTNCKSEMVPQIPLENLYYLLCDAWAVTDQLNKVKVDGEHSQSLENLLA